MTAERDGLRRERDKMEADFKEKISFMESAYESIIHVRQCLLLTVLIVSGVCFGIRMLWI